ncbi:NitT/TauT family transport system ATP-binding protein [Thermocatellispora tengchongensis]|uniref:NitT/TauT family transport system ATP-binding protein n=1 Tax=Thermocatellispora tengchongensis TaxID=1073253 RepID=A0A840PD53_9ACTN|nr:ABC transporter ATP-binding protein [Thermocatellispora tengchongensis]MBB5136646.1 NitT/TauT family transport system ATP-binding protein [Thermocatellispora tengchongensis]
MAITTGDRAAAQAPPRPAAIGIRDVSKVFTRRGATVRALEHASLDIAPGEFVSLIGPSGCGKSTLLKLIAGLLEPSAGTVTVDGAPVTGPLPQVGVAFQKPTLLRWRTVLDNVCLPLVIDGDRRPESREHARRLLEMMGLAGFEKHYPREMSGGMEQRVAIARSLVNRPSLLLMDEPFGALDEFTREDLNDELLGVWQREPKTVVFVTHSISEAVFLSDRIVVMSARPGRIHASLPVPLPRPRGRELRDDPAFYEAIRDVRAVLDEAKGAGR